MTTLSDTLAGRSVCDKCGAVWPSAPAGYVHKCGKCSGGRCYPSTRTATLASEVEGRIIPGQIPPFISVPAFDDREENRACINGCLFLRADFHAAAAPRAGEP
jgi:hypothetical protein